MSAERYMVDDAGTLIDKVTRDNYDTVEEVVSILNHYASTLEKFVDENEQLRQFKEQVASVIESKMGDNVCNDYKMEVLKEIWNELELDEVWFE